jgi:hypothetical protein
MKKNHATVYLLFTLKSKFYPILLYCLLFVASKAYSQSCGSYVYSNVISTNITASINNNTYFLSGDVEIIGDISFTDVEMLIAPNTKISIKNGNTLRILGSHLFSCTDMWAGINIETGGKLIIDRGNVHDNSLIEDAENAVTAGINYTSSNALLSGTNAIEIQNAIFNRNKVGIDFSGSKWGYHTTTIYTVNPVRISKSIFTCRDIPFVEGSLVWTTYSNFITTPIVTATTFPLNPAQYSSPYILESNFSSTNSKAYLKIPATPNTKSNFGIYRNGGMGGFDLRGICKIGDENTNASNRKETIFDNQTVGIHFSEAHLQVNNCIFQNTMNANPNKETYGILVDHYDEGGFAINTSVAAGKPRNAFYDCKYAIVSNFYTNLNINDNDIMSSKRTALGNAEEGFEGITVRSSGFGTGFYFNEINIKNNDISNIQNGITLTHDGSPWNHNQPLTYPYNQAYLAPSIEVGENYVSSVGRFGGIVFPEFFTNVAINLNVVALPFYTTPNTYPPLRCYGNVISSLTNPINNGIIISNWKGKDVRVVNNALFTVAGANSTGELNGITLNGNTAQTNQGNLVFSNLISGESSTRLDFKTGLNITIGSGYNIRCNTSQSLNNNLFRFNGGIGFTTFDRNIMNPSTTNTVNCLVLNSGFIGAQGTNSAANDNRYANATSTAQWSLGHPKLTTINSNPLLSPLFVVRNNPRYDPTTGNIVSFGSAPYSFSNGLNNAPINAYNCGVILNRASLSTEDGTERYVYNSEEIQDVDEASLDFSNEELIAQKVQEAEQLASGAYASQIGDADAEIRHYVMQFELYDQLKANPNLAEQSGFLQEWIASKQNESFGKIQDIIKDISTGSLITAQNKINNFPIQNRVEANYVEFLGWMLKRRQGIALNTTHVLKLAEKCPLTDGSVVFAAQNLYNAITGQHKIFETACAVYANSRSSITKVTPAPNYEIKIYPNPSNSFVNIQGKNIKTIDLIDVTGKVLETKKILNNQSVTFYLGKLNNGILLLRITDNNNAVATRKIIKN